jgi:hypothetical protein
MHHVAVDARRFVWCRGYALWIMGLPVRSYLEDVHGAAAAGQTGLLRYAAGMLGEACAVSLHLTLNHDCPLPGPATRASWALEGLRGHKLRGACWQLIRGVDRVSAAEVVARCEGLVTSATQVVGETPDVLSPLGYYPAIAIARDWLKLMDEFGVGGFLPPSWAEL